MPAATVNGLDETVMGNKRVVMANLTWGNDDTYDTGLANIDSVVFTPTTSAAHGATKSGGTVTLKSGGSLTGDLIAIGT